MQVADVEAQLLVHLAVDRGAGLLPARAPLRDERDVVALASRGWGPHDITMFSAHVNGTCRLGTDPRISGVDESGQRHGVRGLYVADGSLLPTGLGVNPQATIMALATVIAERMAEAGAV